MIGKAIGQIDSFRVITQFVARPSLLSPETGLNSSEIVRAWEEPKDRVLRRRSSHAWRAIYRLHCLHCEKRVQIIRIECIPELYGNVRKSEQFTRQFL